MGPLIPANNESPAVILGYHAIQRGEPAAWQTREQAFYTVEARDFAAQLDLLQRAGCTCCLPENFLASAQNHPKTVLITFDDGHESDLTIVLPALQERSLCATFFVCVDFIGRPGYMNWPQIKALSAAGMSVQSHGMLHHDLTQFSEDDVFHELRSARLCLERNLERPVRYLALPGGFASHQVYRAAARAGYDAVFNSAAGLAYPRKILPRFILRRGTTPGDLEKIILRSRTWLVSAALRHRTSEWIKAVVGVQRYETLKLRFWQ